MLRSFVKITMFLLLTAVPAGAHALQQGGGLSDHRIELSTPDGSDFQIAQRGGTSLSDAIARVRRQGNVQRVVSAETRVSGGREIHYIKVITKDGTVRTHKVPGRQRR